MLYMSGACAGVAVFKTVGTAGRGTLAAWRRGLFNV